MSWEFPVSRAVAFVAVRSRCVHGSPAVSSCARTYSGQRPRSWTRHSGAFGRIAWSGKRKRAAHRTAGSWISIARRPRQPAGQPGPSPPAQRHGHRLQDTFQTACPPAITKGQARHLLGEGGLGARVVAAEEPAAPQMNEHFLAAARGISPASAHSGCAPAATPRRSPGRQPRWHRSGPAHAPTCPQ